MTTATPAPRARRAPALKIYATETRDAMPPRYVCDAVGLAPGRVQAPYFVVATTKAAAKRYLDAAGFHIGAALRVVGGWNDLNAATDAGLLATDGEIIAWREHGFDRARYVVRVLDDRSTVVVGEWQYIEREHGVRVGRKFLVRHPDGARFPLRSSNDPATPSTGWVAPEVQA